MTEELEYIPRDTLLPGRWVDALHLEAGDVLYLRDGREVTLERLTVFVEMQPVYNFTVEDVHTYAIGKAEVLVHNTECPKWTHTSSKSGVQNAYSHFKKARI